MTERTHSSLSVKVKSAKETERQLDDTFAERKHELDAAQKHKEALCLNCDTVDQALENVLREVILAPLVSTVIRVWPSLSQLQTNFALTDKERIPESHQTQRTMLISLSGKLC